MFIAHLPSGIIYGYCLSRSHKAEHLTKPLIYIACFLGATAPDLDMFYFYFIDNKQTLHHQYWSHLPGCGFRFSAWQAWQQSFQCLIKPQFMPFISLSEGLYICW